MGDLLFFILIFEEKRGVNLGKGRITGRSEGRGGCSQDMTGERIIMKYSIIRGKENTSCLS